MTTAPTLIPRTGLICFHDAHLSVWEEGIPSPGAPGGFKARDAWEAQFKAEVFDLVAATLIDIGWTVGPWGDAHLYKALAKGRRTCSHKSGLQAELGVSGRTVELKMWQDVTPSENPNGGKHDFDKLDRMPYLLRLEVERTRRRVIKALCDAHSGYTIKKPAPVLGLTGVTAVEMAKHHRMTTGHYKPALDRAEISMSSNAHARDGGTIEHGSKVWAVDRSGRVITGTAYYDLNNNWDIVSGRYGLQCLHTGHIFTQKPEYLRDRWGRLSLKDNQRQRRKRLEQELQKAIKAMDFDRAKVLKGILFPSGPLYAIFSKQHGVYFDIMYAGYRKKLEDAGKYTRAELKPYLGDKLETDQYKAVLVSE